MIAGKVARASVAVVTGAAQGIGKSISLKLASLGYCVVLGDIPSKRESLSSVHRECKKLYSMLPDKPGLESLHLDCNVTVESQVDALVDAAVKRFGGLDVMVANAGVVKTVPLLEASTNDFDETYKVNAKGLWLSYRAAARVMIPAGSGRIIGAASCASTLALPLFGPYSASKAAVRSITHTAAREWGPHGITVNAYAPGAVDTNMWLNDVMGGSKSHLINDMVMETTPTKTKTTPEQVAGLVAFLISPAAQNITGQCISVDGGFIMN